MYKRLLLVLAMIIALTTPALMAGEIIHDAEYYVLEAQYGEQWAEQDEELLAKLDALEEKHGTPLNIIHIMWDDTPVGGGWHSPHPEDARLGNSQHQ